MSLCVSECNFYRYQAYILIWCNWLCFVYTFVHAWARLLYFCWSFLICVLKMDDEERNRSWLGATEATKNVAKQKGQLSRTEKMTEYSGKKWMAKKRSVESMCVFMRRLASKWVKFSDEIQHTLKWANVSARTKKVSCSTRRSSQKIEWKHQ